MPKCYVSKNQMFSIFRSEDSTGRVLCPAKPRSALTVSHLILSLQKMKPDFCPQEPQTSQNDSSHFATVSIHLRVERFLVVCYLSSVNLIVSCHLCILCYLFNFLTMLGRHDTLSNISTCCISGTEMCFFATSPQTFDDYLRLANLHIDSVTKNTQVMKK